MLRLKHVCDVNCLCGLVHFCQTSLLADTAFAPTEINFIVYLLQFSDFKTKTDAS